MSASPQIKPPSALAFILAFGAIYRHLGYDLPGDSDRRVESPPFLLSGSRLLLAGLILAGWLALKRGFRPMREWRDSLS